MVTHHWRREENDLHQVSQTTDEDGETHASLSCALCGMNCCLICDMTEIMTGGCAETDGNEYLENVKRDTIIFMAAMMEEIIKSSEFAPPLIAVLAKFVGLCSQEQLKLSKLETKGN